jgi:putative membrane protein
MRPIENPVPVPTRQSAVALWFIIGTFLRRIARQAWPLLIVAFMKPDGEQRLQFLLYIVIFVAVTTLVISLLNYFRFYFWIENGALVIEKGVLKRSRLAIPFERIQTMNSEQNIFFRFFSVVKLDIDTAGSKGSEVSLQAISSVLSEQLRGFVFQQKQHIDAEPGAEETAAGNFEDEAETGTTLLKLNALDLLKIGISQDHLRAVLILMAFAFSRFEDAREILGDRFNEYLDQASDNTILSNMYALSALFLLVLFASFLVSLVRTLVRYYGFSLVETNTGLKTFYGLLTRREKHMSFRKMQLFQYSTGPVRRLFGLNSIRISQASPDELSKKEAVIIPGAYDKDLRILKDRFFSNVQLPEDPEHRISPLIIGRSTLFSGLVPALMVGIIIYLSAGISFAFLPLFYVAFIAIRSWLYQRNFRYDFSEDAFLVRSGKIGQVCRIVLFYKIQSVEIRQTLFQQRRGLANLGLYTAAGEVSIPYITLGEARMLRNYILYKIESNKEGWM